MKKVLIIGERGFIGNHLYNYLKKSFHLKKISFKDLNKFKNKLNNFDFVINSSINKSYIQKKYNEKFDNDYRISKLIDNQKTIYCFISTRKVYPSKANLKETSKLSPKSYYSKNKLFTEKKISKKLKTNFLILRVSNIIGETKMSKRIHHTFIDAFQRNIQKGIVLDNGKIFKDFLSIDKFCQILKEIINKKLTGTYNVSIGQKIYIKEILNWLNKKNKNKKNFIYIKKKRNQLDKDSFSLNNSKLSNTINYKPKKSEVKKFCLKLSKIIH